MLALTGLTLTDATGTRLTAIVAPAVFPSTVAVIVAEPGATAVTIPVVEMVATELALVAHDTDLPVSEPPAESVALADRFTVSPTYKLAVAGDTDTADTGTRETVSGRAADFPCAVAVIDAVPGAIPATTPVELTVATSASLDVHATLRPVRTFPAASLRDTATDRAWPAYSVIEVTSNLTSATGTGGGGVSGPVGPSPPQANTAASKP